MNEPDEDVNTVVQNNKEVIDLTNSTDEEDDVAEDINNDVPAEEVKKQRKPYKNYSRELKEYLETTHLVDHIKSLEDELQQHKDIIDKHKDMMSVMNDELIKKNKKIKRLKNKQYGPEDIHDFYEQYKYHTLDPDDSEPIADLDTGTPENKEHVENLFKEFAEEFHKRYKAYHNLKENDA